MLPKDYLRALRRGWFFVLIAVLLGGGAAAGYSLRQVPVYSASTKVFVAVQAASNVQEVTAGGNFVQQAVASYADVATSSAVLDPVIGTLGLDTTSRALANRVTASVGTGTVIIDISARDSDPDAAAVLANAVASQLERTVEGLAPARADEQSFIRVAQIDVAVPAASPIAPRTTVNIALGVVAGLLVGFAGAVAWGRLDTRIRGVSDVPEVTDRPVVGAIGYDRATRTRPLIVDADPYSPRAESFRTLRTNLQFLDFGRGSRTMVITSSVAGEGKSTTAANLAVAIGDTGQKVVIVEADLRMPRLSVYFGLDGSVGLTDVLVGAIDLDEALQEWGGGRVTVLSAGAIPPNPSELLQGPAMVTLISQLKKRFGTVVFDAPPLLPVSDAAILARRTSGALVVAAAGRAKKEQLQSAIASVQKVGAPVLGVVVTMLPNRAVEAGGYGAPTRVGPVKAQPGPAPERTVRDAPA